MEHLHFGYARSHADSFEHINYIINGSGIVLVKTLIQNRYFGTQEELKIQTGLISHFKLYD
jgi:hypothetical protein